MSYYWTWFLLNSSEYGVPQNRTRFFAIGAQDFTPEQPKQTHSEFGKVLGTEPVITLWSAISDLPKVGIGERQGVFNYENLPESLDQEWARQNSQKVYNHTTQNHSQRVLEKIRLVPRGKGMETLLKNNISLVPWTVGKNQIKDDLTTQNLGEIKSSHAIQLELPW